MDKVRTCASLITFVRMSVYSQNVKVLFIPPDTSAKEISFYTTSKKELIELSNGSTFYKKERNADDGFQFSKYDSSEQVWMPSVIITIVIIFIVSRVAYHHKYRQLLQSLLASRYMKLAMREERALNHPFSVLLTINYCLAGAMIIYLVMKHFSIVVPELQGILLFFVLFLIVLGILIVKTVLKKIFQFIIGEDGGQSEDRFNLYFFNQALGIALIPPVIISCFAHGNLQEAAIWFSCIMIVLCYLFRLGRGITVGLASGSSAFYLFLYLCTLEITPLIVMTRVLVSEIG